MADNPKWRAMAACDLPDRTTLEWLHLARRDDGTRRTSAEDVKERSTPGRLPHRHVPSTDIPCCADVVNDSDRVERTASR